MNALRFLTALGLRRSAPARYATHSLRLPYFCGAAPTIKHDEGGSRTMEVRGLSGRHYTIEKILQEKHMPFGRVYLASDGAINLVLKEIPQDYEIRKDLYLRAKTCPHVRALVDTVPSRWMFVFEHLELNLLRFVQGDVPLTQMKYILKSVLEGLAALHAVDIVHNDVKPTNILFNTSTTDEGLEVEQVQLIDLEDAAHVGPDEYLSGAQLGNWMWRSPESHAEGPIEKPSDLFSFGLVCIYAMTKAVIMAVDRSSLPESVRVLDVVIERQISYFADPEGYDGFMRYLDHDNPWRQTFNARKAGFNKANPRRPVALWKRQGLHDDFKDLVIGLTNFDPGKRLTAQQSLQHKWFEGV